MEEIDQVFLYLCLAPSNHYCNEGIWRLHCTGKPTLLSEDVIPPVMQKESSVLSMNRRLIGLVPPVSIQISLSCICICIWILFISYKYKRHSRVIWWGPLPLAMCRLLRLVRSTNHDHRSSHTCKRLLKQTWCRLLLFLSSGDYVNRLFCFPSHDHRSSHPCTRLFKHSARHDVDSCFSYPC